MHASTSLFTISDHINLPSRYLFHSLSVLCLFPGSSSNSKDISIPDEKREDIATVLGEIFEDTNTDASVLVSSSNMRIGEVRAEKKIIANALSQKEQELERYKEKTVARKYETKNINGADYMLIPTEKNTTVIDGVEYVLIPVHDVEK